MSKLRELMLREMHLRHYSPKTIGHYVDALVRLSKYYNQSPADLTNDQIKDYLFYLINTKQVSRSTVNQLLSALKLLWEGVLDRPWEDLQIKRPRLSKELPVVFSKEEVRKLLSIPRNLKHRTCLSLAYSAGLRVSELSHLMPEDIDCSRMQIRVFHGKGPKTRYVPLAENILDLLDEYQRFYHTQKYLFEGHKAGEPLSTSTIGVVFRRALKQSGIQKKATFHTLRHSYATHLLEAGVNLKVIQNLLGHTSLRTTSIYFHVQDVSKLHIRSPFDTLTMQE
jgi:site-specific recombinase XerD